MRRAGQWTELEIGALARFSSGSGISIAALHGQSTDFPVPVYGGNGIAGYTDRPNVDCPTVVIGRVGQRCGQVHMTTGPALVTDNALYPTSILRQFDLGFFGLALSAARLNDVKNRNDLPLVTQAILHAVRLPWPEDVDEQRAIAAALSDVDALIGALDRLIAKKRDLKQAAMQQLLTGQTRLPGFSGEWEIKRVEECGDVLAGKALNADGPGVRRPYLRTANVLDGCIDLGDVLEMPFTATEFEHFRLRSGDVLLNEGQSLELVGRCSMYRDEFEKPCAMQNALLRFRARDDVSPEFAAHVFRHCQRSGIFGRIATQTTSVAHLGSVRFAKLALPWPLNHAEQLEIASVLTGMDAELASIEQRRHKTRRLKQGMMQELLTGRIRLV
jgi:type I restriction enzyme S subunit